jgi:hypothetical protein
MNPETLLELLRTLIFQLAPPIALAGVHRYTVTNSAGDGRYDLEPAPKVLHGPRLRVEQMSAPGVEAGLSVGDELAIVFLDNDERYPAIIAHAPLRRSKPGTLKIDATTLITIGASAPTINLGGVGAVALATAAGVNAALTLFSAAIVSLGGAPVVWSSLNTTKVTGV